ncbi:hypothetical protein EJ070_13520 [Mesorhizobium sp. M1E.F.Ca.ET.045.02.1.1]|uniref:hypothetical protein n=1 Tax=unclassified Mesorhizobium TaxID=325217 RepID=UPI000F74C142|nr:MULTISPECIES: hypothetical protein [unclassified Mesorhizobium]AZO21594.1 hypothetical protein EJ070_13520 [Mesorhizobium sp. M1E.F.Ca.ET.045.02.1.1]RUW85171.1 hypothetical protein EOA29_06060 [Mesorhizobium sp. M1E.F.Ca.ET.063.01.1.1]
MADSDNTTPLSFVTRRLLMTQLVAVAGLWPFGARARENMSIKGRQDDPALRLCESWHEVHRSTSALCRQQQRLETYLVEAIGFPCAKMQLPGGGEKTIHSVESLEELYSPENEVAWDRALADLAAHRARWDATDAEIGFSRTDELIQRSEAAEQALLDDLPLTPACSVEGVLAKLLVILRYGEHWEDPDEFPRRHIRSVLDDLARYHHIDPTTIIASCARERHQECKGSAG